MDNSKDNINSFLLFDKSSKLQDSKLLFGGDSVQNQGGNSGIGNTNLVTKPPVSQKIFGNQSVFGSLPSTSTNIVSPSSSSCETSKNNEKKLFNKTFQSANSGSTIQKGNIFGQCISDDFGCPTLKKINENPVFTTLASKYGSLKSKSDTMFGSNSQQSNLESSKYGSLKSKSDSMFGSNSQLSNPETSEPASSLFSLQSKESKDSKDNIFGGKIAQAHTQFKSFETINDSKSKHLVNEPPPYEELQKSASTSFNTFGKPEKVFANIKAEKDASVKPFAFESLIKTSTNNKQKYVFKKVSNIEKDDDLSSILKVEHKDSQVKKVVHSTALIACNIPNNFVNASILKNHFSKFGSVEKVEVNEKTSQAVIYFFDYDSAQEAKVKGKSLHPLLNEMKLFFRSQSQGTKPVEKLDSKTMKSSTKISPRTSPYNKKLDSFAKKTKVVKPLERNKSASLLSKSETKNKAPSGNLVLLKDFSGIVKTQAKNNYDKFLILDARDKNIRSKQEKIVDVKKAHYLLATCPDMCPEKERYSRDIQYDISVYEMTNNEIDHKLTVKKFSRSSADKDEPLPHELRPGPVLKMTMDFLVYNIVQKGDNINVQIDLWYNYLCNRTRGLRSDIMQQHLLDENAVYVLERCIRFHIHCSHALCEESPEYFDAKMNSEHLSKSLQSLKELYHDLEDRGYSFENEAEFRSYEILLSINDGNVFFKYLKFKDSIRNSPEVQFAVKVLHSIHTSNYANFFKLLKKASYLQSCIMYKFFGSLRLKALNVIIKAYSVHSPPVDNITSMLGFSNEAELLKYLGHFDIDVNELTAAHSKAKLVAVPAVLPPAFKSVDISVKKNKSLVEIINNGPLPKNPLNYYTPHNSFDSKGYLKKDAIDASDQNCKIDVAFEPDQQNESFESTCVLEKENEFTEMEKVSYMLQRKLKEMHEIKVLSRYFRGWKKFTNFHKRIRDIEEKWKINNSKKMFFTWRKKAQEIAISRRKAEEFFLLKYFTKWKVYTHCCRETRALVEATKGIEKNILMKKFFNLWKFKVNMIKSVRKEKYVRDHILRFKYFYKWLNATEESIAKEKSDIFYRLKLVRSSFLQWKSWCVMKKNRNKVNAQLFPAIGSLLSIKAQNQLLDWGYNREDDSYISADDISKLDDDIFIKSVKHYSLEKLSSIMSWMTLPLIDKFRDDILTKSPDLSGNLFLTCFKILILIDYTDIDPYLLKWVRSKFNILEYDDLSDPLDCQSQFSSPHNEIKYSIIVTEKKLSFQLPIFDSYSVVILVGIDDKLEHLKKFSDTLGKVPYLILCKSYFESILSQNTWLLTKEMIDNPYTSEKLLNFLLSQWSDMKNRFRFQINRCSKVVSNFISTKVISCVIQELSHRQMYGKPSLQPNIIVSFYNAAICHLKSCFEKAKFQISNNSLSEKFSQNYHLSSMRNDNEFQEIIVSLENACLPEFNIDFEKSWSEIEENLVRYIGEMNESGCWKGSLYSEVKLIIKETRKKFFEDKFYCDDNVKLDKFWYYIPWGEIFNCFILFKISKLSDAHVVYKSADLYEFDCSNFWLSEMRVSELVSLGRQKEDTPHKRKATVALPKKNTKKIKSESSLLQDLEEEKQKAIEYERKLESLMALHDEDINFLKLNNAR